METSHHILSKEADTDSAADISADYPGVLPHVRYLAFGKGFDGVLC